MIYFVESGYNSEGFDEYDDETDDDNDDGELVWLRQKIALRAMCGSPRHELSSHWWPETDDKIKFVETFFYDFGDADIVVFPFYCISARWLCKTYSC